MDTYPPNSHLTGLGLLCVKTAVHMRGQCLSATHLAQYLQDRKPPAASSHEVSIKHVPEQTHASAKGVVMSTLNTWRDETGIRPAPEQNLKGYRDLGWGYSTWLLVPI